MITNKLPIAMATKIPITHEHITISILSAVYTGNEIFADDLITITYYDRVLASEDYILTGETSAIGAGTYSVTVTGIGDFTGSTTVSWNINRKYVVFDHVIVDINGTDEYDSNSGGSKENIEISRHYGKDIEMSVMVVGYFNQDKTAIIEDIENNNTTTIGTSNMTACTVLRQASGILWSVNPGTWGYYGLVQTLPIKIEFTNNYGHCSIDLNWNSANYYGSVSVYVRSIYV